MILNARKLCADSFLKIKINDNRARFSRNQQNSEKFDSETYSLSPGFWQSFISIEVCRDCIPALASSCKKQLTGFFVCLLFLLKVKRIS